MKQLIPFVAALSVVCSASAQSVRVARIGAVETENGVRISVPTTPLAVDLIVEKDIVTAGPYARYAQKYLGTRGALTDKTSYAVRSARIALADPAHLYPTAEPLPQTVETCVSYLGGETEFARVWVDRSSSADRTLEDGARSAANTIYAIRRHRMELITGEAGENVFGGGLKAALEELDRQEQAYTELFLGKRVISTSVHRTIVEPQADKQKYIVCRFSATAGVLPDNDLTGEVVLLQLDKEPERSSGIVPADRSAKNTATYRVAADVVCTLYNGSEVLTKTTLPVFEFGRNVELAVPARR